MLKISDLNVWYHKAQVLTHIDIEVPEGTFVSIIGANGAGKTTLLRSIVNLHQNKTGRVWLAGKSIDSLPAHKIIRQGISYVPDYRGILKTLTVKENLAIARDRYPNSAEFDREMATVMALFPNLKYRLNMVAALLSGGEQQMLAIARALIYKPRVLLIDEPSIGLAPLLVEEIFKNLQDLTRQGMSILMVEQNVLRSLAASDYCYVLEKGRVILDGDSETVANHPDLKARYFGIDD